MDKIKLYLDTNMILDFFVNQAMYFKGKQEQKVPEKMKFLLENMDRFEFVLSFITKAEVTRELVAGFGVEYERVERFWSEFTQSLKNLAYVDKFEFDDKLVELSGKLGMKLRTMFNFMHLFIAMKKEAYFVSGDKDIVLKAKTLGLYDKVISYVELRELISS